MALMYELNRDCLEDERRNLDIQLSPAHSADRRYWPLGWTAFRLWGEPDRKYPGLACTASWTISPGMWIKNGDLRCDAVHHDGTNHYLYRVYKDTATQAQIDRLKEKLYAGTATRADITRITRRLGDAIGSVYGWEFPRRALRPDRER